MANGAISSGSQQKKLIEQWRGTFWTISFDGQSAKQFYTQKRQLEKQVETEKAKRLKLEAETTSLQKQVKCFGTVSRRQARTITALRLGRNEKASRTSSKNWSDYSRAHQSVKRKQIVAEMKAALSSSDQHFMPVSIEVENIESGEKESIDLLKGNFNKSYKPQPIQDISPFALFVKDKFTISDSAYHELSQLSPDLPRLINLKGLSKELNSEFDIKPSPHGYTGVQQSLKSRLLCRLKHLQLTAGEIIQVKLTGDGTYIAKNIHVVNFAFTLLNEGQAASSVFGNHSLSIIEIPEDYDSLSSALADIVQEASELQSIEVYGREHRIQYFLGGDMKFLAIAVGIEAANSTFACVWCKCPSTDRWDMEQEWSAFDASKGARTVTEIEEFKKLPKTKRFGCRSSPIFKFIAIDHVIIDNLHLYLRLTDLHINLLIQDLRREDGIAKACLDLSKHQHLVAYEKFLNNDCNIHFAWYTSKESKQMQWRDLSGPEKVRLFSKIDIPKLFPALPNAPAIQDIWTELWRLFSELNDSTDPNELRDDIKNWVKMFLKIYQTKNVTPYMHAFAFHVPEFMDKYGSICKFTQQGLEKLNDSTTQHFLRSTNHRSTEAYKQVMEKRNRLEQLEDDGFKRTLTSYHCSICGQSGHNKRKSPSRPPLEN